MPEWHKLRHAYGPASDLPEILERLSPGCSATDWNDAWSCLCHQGTVYTASFAALPILLQAAASWPAQDRAMVLALSAAIVSSDDVQGSREELVRDLDPTIAAFAELANESLGADGLSDTDFIYVAQAALAFQGDQRWGRELDHLTSGEFDGQCPICSASLFLVIGTYGFFATTDEWVNRPLTKRNPIRPANAEALLGVARWLEDQAMTSGHSVVGLWIRYLFGETDCPACGNGVAVEDAIRRVSG